MLHFFHLTIGEYPHTSNDYPFSLRSLAAGAHYKNRSFTISSMAVNSTALTKAEHLIKQEDILVLIPGLGAIEIFSSWIRKLQKKIPPVTIIIAGESARRFPEIWAKRGYFVLVNQRPDVFIQLIDAIFASMPLSHIDGIAYEKQGMFMLTKKSSSPPEEWIRHIKLGHMDQEGPIRISSGFPTTRFPTLFYPKNPYWIKRTLESLLYELQTICKKKNSPYIAFVDPYFVDPVDDFHAIVQFLKENFLGIWSIVLPVDFPLKHSSELSNMVASGLYRVSLSPHSASKHILTRLGADFTPRDIEKSIDRLVKNGVLSISLDFSIGVSGETQQTIQGTKAFALKMIHKYPGRVEIRPRFHDPLGVNYEDNLYSSVSFTLEMSKEKPGASYDGLFYLVDHAAHVQKALFAELGAFQSDILKAYMDLLNKIPYPTALAHLDLDTFQAMSAWGEMLMNVPHIRAYSRAYNDYQNILTTYPLPNKIKIFSCYPMRTMDNFIYTENEEVILKLFVNKVSALDEISSYIYKLCSGDLTCSNIVDKVVAHYKLPSQKISQVTDDVIHYLIELERSFLIVLTNPFTLST